MPPRAPNLKFKPKMVRQSKQPGGGAPDEHKDLSLVQLERLQRHDQVATPPPDGAPAVHAAAAAPTPAPKPSRPTRQTGTSVSFSGGDGGGGGGGGGSGSASHSSPARKSAAAQLHEATERYYDSTQDPERAHTWPVNTINSLLEDGPDASENARSYRPIPICDEGCASASAADAPHDVRGGGGLSGPDATLDGTAFLRAAEDEARAAWDTNRRFHETVLCAAPEGSQEGHLTWMQIPRFHGRNPPFVLSNLPPGKVGELKVLRSGRIVMDIAGVHYEVMLDDQDSLSADASSIGGACSTVAVTEPSSFPMDPSVPANCYEVGTLEKKLVCMPTIAEQR